MHRKIQLAPSYDDLIRTNPRDDDSVDSNYQPDSPTIATNRESDAPEIRATLESEKYDAAVIRKEFRSYQAILPAPDVLLQEKTSFSALRKKFEQSGIEPPRFLRYKFEEGIKPHHALCCLLLSEYVAEKEEKKADSNSVYRSLIWFLSFGTLHRQLNNPAAFIRYQFNLVAHAIPTNVISPPDLRKTIRNRGLPVPNYFLDPENDKQFPPHIALLVILQDGEDESKKFDSLVTNVAFSLFAFVALLLRIVLEVIGGAGAIWGGAEVFTLRTSDNREFWRWASVAVGVFCLFRFVIVNVPRREDEGDILGPAGPWSLRLPLRLRAVCDHPFHYFVRASSPSFESKKDD